MEKLIHFILLTHVLAGSIALLTGAMEIFSRKGMQLHRITGKLYEQDSLKVQKINGSFLNISIK